MALTPRSGSPISSSGLSNIPNEIPNTQSDIVPNMPYVQSSLLNKYSINPTQTPNMTAMLAGFAKGHRVSVTYYRLLKTGNSNIRTNIADYQTVTNVLDTEFQKILNLEITLPRGFEFSANPDDTSIDITGQALFYPNMNPSIGDNFLANMGDGKIGIARISKVLPLSWRTDRFYTVEFMIQSFADSSDIAALDGAVVIRSVFSKENYLGGTAALLSEDSYIILQNFRKLRGILARYYHSTFWDYELSSYIRPDGIYDPHCVQFMSRKLTIDEVKYKPKNLLGKNEQEYNKSIWARLEDRYNTTLNGISGFHSVNLYRPNALGVFVTELSGYSYISLSDDDTNDSYIFSSEFYSNTLTDQSEGFEVFLNSVIVNRSVGDIRTLSTNWIDTVYTLSKDLQYYRIPLYIHFIDMALQSQYRNIDSDYMDYAFNGDV